MTVKEFLKKIESSEDYYLTTQYADLTYEDEPSAAEE